MNHAVISPNPWMILPFVALLALIALAPLFFAGFWGRHYPKVAGGLGAVTVGYYLLSLGASERVIHTGVEYLSFIALIGSLYVVAGGIHIRVKGEATPWGNVVFLAVGAVLANVLGTTGASMLLVRPWLRMNRYRVTAYHVVFFIFIVSNVGGCLTPIGDPPLFLGYLKGVPFWWVIEHCWGAWLTAVGILLGMFWVVDHRNFLRAPRKVREAQTHEPEHWKFEGLANIGFLAVILAAVFVNRPAFLREAMMVAAAVGSYFTTRKSVHEANDFNFHPLKEVAVLFVGIFATMMPALDWLQGNAVKLGEPSVSLYYWGSGALSSVLDNAPTYLSFLSAALGGLVPGESVMQMQALVAAGGSGMAEATDAVRMGYGVLEAQFPAALAAKTVGLEEVQLALLLGDPRLMKYLVAISLGAVFFGANTYIGNGPNFMVKAIAEQQSVRTPGFVGYVLKYALPFMLPMLVVVWWFFVRD